MLELPEALWIITSVLLVVSNAIWMVTAREYRRQAEKWQCLFEKEHRLSNEAMAAVQLATKTLRESNTSRLQEWRDKEI